MKTAKMRESFHKITHFIVTTFACVAFWSCSDSSEESVIPNVGEATRSVLVYMVADNNLAGDAQNDLNEMKCVAAEAAAESGGRWIVYFSGTDLNPRLIEFGEAGEEKVLATYTANETSVSINRMQAVLNDFRRLAPARTYGLVLWSHGSGWMSESNCVSEQPTVSDGRLDPMSFGYDGQPAKRMKVTSLADALRGFGFDFIYFDCCHMSTTEVAYELRDCARRMVACPTELAVEGMPYDRNIPCLLNGNLSDAVRNTFDYYREAFEYPTANEDRSPYGCAIAELNLQNMDALAEATRMILESGTMLPDGYDAAKYFRAGTGVAGIYDMSHYIKAISPDDAAFSEWERAFESVVIQNLHTSKVYMLDAADFSGLGSHIVADESDADRYGYRELQWWQDVVKFRYETN